MGNEFDELGIPGMGLYKKQSNEEYIQEQIKIKKFFDIDKLVLVGMEESFPWSIYQLEKLFADKIMFVAHKMECDSIRTNGNLASVLQDVIGYNINPVDIPNILKNPTDFYTMGTIEDIKLVVDPLMKWSDNRILFVKDNEVLYDGEVIDTHEVFI